MPIFGILRKKTLIITSNASTRCTSLSLLVTVLVYHMVIMSHFQKNLCETNFYLLNLSKQLLVATLLCLSVYFVSHIIHLFPSDPKNKTVWKVTEKNKWYQQGYIFHCILREENNNKIKIILTNPCETSRWITSKTTNSYIFQLQS